MPVSYSYTGFSRRGQRFFRPQPSWRGTDYFEAHALNPDLALYLRVRESQYTLEGVGLSEAKHWHQQIYRRSGDIYPCSPHYMGHAAAYETYRIWNHDPSVTDPGSDYGQRREAFIAIAIAEVFHILKIDEADHERRKLEEACKSAAAIASTVFRELPNEGRPGGGHISPCPSPQPSSPLYEVFPDDSSVTHRSRGHSRRSSSASNSHLMPIPSVNGSPRQLPDDHSVTHESRSHSRRSSPAQSPRLMISPSISMNGSSHHSLDDRGSAHGSHSRSRRSSSASNSHPTINPSARSSPRQPVPSLSIDINNFDRQTSNDSGSSYYPSSSPSHATSTYPSQHSGVVQSVNFGNVYAPNPGLLHPNTYTNVPYYQVVVAPTFIISPPTTTTTVCVIMPPS